MSPHSKSQSGFVLPYVLIVIAIMSIVITLAAGRIQKTSNLFIEIEERSEAKLALASAEAQATYVFLTSVPYIEGVNLTPVQGLTLLRVGSEKSSENDYTPDVWKASGEDRVVNTNGGDVICEYRDISGFVPLNGSEPKYIEALLTYLGVGTSEKESLTAKLFDYKDVDNSRRFQGAEKAGYRLKNLPSPTNAPLRSFSELSNVMGWNELLEKSGDRKVMSLTTLSTETYHMKTTFMNPGFADSIDVDEVGSQTSVDSIVRAGLYPTNVGRFTCRLKLRSGDIFLQSTEVEKTIGQLKAPFNKFLVYEAIDAPQTDEERVWNTTGLKDVIRP